jgi:DNA-binding MarR family transcriptional regulator
MVSPEALSDCLVLNTVAAARVLLRRYDRKLKPYGVTVQQFALLATLRFHPGQPVAGLAPKVALDRTSLLRNLDLLEKRGLVERAASAGNVRVCQLTAEGDRLLDALLLEWSGAQAELLSRLPDGDAARFLHVARALSED